MRRNQEELLRVLQRPELPCTTTSVSRISATTSRNARSAARPVASPAAAAATPSPASRRPAARTDCPSGNTFRTASSAGIGLRRWRSGSSSPRRREQPFPYMAPEAAPARYCGRIFNDAELDQIRRLIAANPAASRAQLSRLVCAELSWSREDGRLKEMSCRVAMLRMQTDGLLQLPPPRNGNHNGKPWHRRTAQAEPDAPLRADGPRSLGTLKLQRVSHRAESQLHNEYLDRYHYLGYQPLPGAQLRYFVRAGGRLVALLSFAAAAWKTQPRDHYIGWTPAQRQEHLHRVVNNARFLILPWIECRNLASSILARAARQIAADWQLQYGYRPLLLETFVEQSPDQDRLGLSARQTLQTGHGLGTRHRHRLPLHSDVQQRRLQGPVGDVRFHVDARLGRNRQPVDERSGAGLCARAVGRRLRRSRRERRASSARSACCRPRSSTCATKRSRFPMRCWSAIRFATFHGLPASAVRWCRPK
jgi:hypothetical protein